jgi:hypothetical protein
MVPSLQAGELPRRAFKPRKNRTPAWRNYCLGFWEGVDVLGRHSGPIRCAAASGSKIVNRQPWSGRPGSKLGRMARGSGSVHQDRLQDVALELQGRDTVRHFNYDPLRTTTTAFFRLRFPHVTTILSNPHSQDYVYSSSFLWLFAWRGSRERASVPCMRNRRSPAAPTAEGSCDGVWAAERTRHVGRHAVFPKPNSSLRVRSRLLTQARRFWPTTGMCNLIPASVTAGRRSTNGSQHRAIMWACKTVLGLPCI